MVIDWLPSVLIVVLLALGVIGALRRVSLWRAGQPEKVNLIAGLLAMPGRYLKDLHHVVERDKYMSRTHVATGGGFVLSMVLVLIVHVFNVQQQIVAWALIGALLIMLTGAFFVFKRRLNPPERLSKGPWMRLPKSLIIYSLTFIVLTLPAAGILPDASGSVLMIAVLSVGIVIGLGELLFGMGWGGPI